MGQVEQNTIADQKFLLFKKHFRLKPPPRDVKLNIIKLFFHGCFLN